MSRSIIDGVRRLLGSSTASVVECRRCGTTLDEGADQCPECGSEAVSRYEL